MTDAAVRRAREVVGLYGDPGVTWSIVLRLTLRQPVEADALGHRAELIHEAHGHLGRVPTTQRYAPADRAEVLRRVADEPFGDEGPLARIALAESGHELVVALHHGCVDGLGLLGYAAALTGLDLPSSARGVPRGSEPGDFVRSSLRRLREALLRPPRRLSRDRPGTRTGDALASQDVPGEGASTAALLLAAVRTARAWTGDDARGSRPLVVAVGLSRRAGSPTPPPDRDTAYARLAADEVATLADARRLLAGVTPEPAFPQTSAGGVGPLLTRLLAPRLGSTLLISNLGLVDQPAVGRVEFWPVPAGPAGVCLGMASTPTCTTVTARLRRAWFDPAQAASLVGSVARELSPAEGPQ